MYKKKIVVYVLVILVLIASFYVLYIADERSCLPENENNIREGVFKVNPGSYDNELIPPIDQNRPSNLKTATLALG